MKLSRKKRKILILSMPIGSGHIKAAEALAWVGQNKFNCEVEHINFLDWMSPELTGVVKKSYFWMVKYMPFLNKWTYYGSNKPNEKLKKLGEDFDFKKYSRLIEKYRPDLIISTHILPAMIVSWMFRKYPIPNGVVITDYDSHSMWVYPHNDRIFVGCKEVLTDLEKLGINRDRITVSGIPVRNNFLKKFNRNKLKEKFKLDLDKKTFLLMSGGTATGPLVSILKSLSKFKNNIQVIVITGHNEKLAKRISTNFSLLKLKGLVLTFVDNIEEYMSVADVLISKAGGLTTTEAITLGLPMLVVRPTPGQEDGNTNFLVNGGAAVYIKDVKKIDSVVKDLLDHPDKLRKMSLKSRRLANPKAAEVILGKMLEF